MMTVKVQSECVCVYEREIYSLEYVAAKTE